MTGRQGRFGEQLRRFREAAGFSQEELAERAGLSANGISALERGERKRPYPDTLRRLAEALGLTEAQRAELAATLRSRPEDPVPVVVQPTPGVAADLPGEPTPLIGRERESEVVRYLLTHSGSRLLTLIGPGGVGKTRLALHVARTVGSQYPDGVVWVPLASLGDPALVLPALAPQLGIKAATAGDPRDAIVSHLRDRRMLLVLDNFEHVLDAATDVADLLLACPTLCVLATSRAPLNVRGEQEYVVPPLELPPAERAELDEIASVPSVRLFVWQARQKHPAFELTEGNVGIVAEICRRLEGVPLALELAAARIKLLGVSDLLDRLDRALPVLTGGPRDLPARQRTMEGAIRWSYDLLDPTEQALFRRLSVFSGGWTLEAAEAVVCAPGALGLDTLEGMGSLVDKSLVRQVEAPDGSIRFAMLRTFREFGLARMDETGEIHAARRAHLEWYTAVAEATEAGLVGPGQTEWLDRAATEHDNFRAALGHSLPEVDELRGRLAGALWRFWWWRGHHAEGRACLDQVLASPHGLVSPWRAKALLAAGILAREQGDFDHAATHLEGSLAIRRELQDRPGSAQTLNVLGLLASDRGDYVRAAGYYEEGLALYRELGDTLGIANILNNLGIAAREQGDFARAAELYTESLPLLRAIGEKRGVANALHNLGRVARDQGDLDRAVELFGESLVYRQEVGDRLGYAMTINHLGNIARDRGDSRRAVERYIECLEIRRDLGDKLGCVKTVEDIAALAVGAGHAVTAARFLGAANAHRVALGAPVPPADREQHERIVARVREQLDAAAFDAHLGEGRSLDAEELVDEAVAWLAAFCDEVPGS